MEKYRIHYIQSTTVSDIIKSRKYSTKRKGLLAFGGAVYERNNHSDETINNQKQLAYLHKQVNDALKQRGSALEYYDKLGYSRWTNLPATLLEVISIGQILPGGEIITGEAVQEEKIKELSATGILSNYKIIHFATHGIVVPEVPELSAVVLSQSAEQAKGGKLLEDGYLTMGEIVELDIEADFVNLSACETGLGKIYAGEGVVGLTQSFLLAGANSLAVSLWSVADQSTARFMVALYQLAEEGMNYQQAINEVKLRFINGDFGAEYQKPYYWAPFVYYGG